MQREVDSRAVLVSIKNGDEVQVGRGREEKAMPMPAQANFAIVVQGPRSTEHHAGPVKMMHIQELSILRRFGQC